MRAELALTVALIGAAHLSACVDADDTDDGTCDPDVADCSGLGGDDGKADGASVASLAQMNDLTIVFPLAKTAAELTGDLPASTIGPNGALLPSALYLKEFPDMPNAGSNVGEDTQMTYADLRVVAIRFDPCFAQIGPITDATTCDNQLRLVFQSLTFTDGSTGAIDGAVHAFYRLSRADLTAAIREVIALRRANGQTTAMGPLAPHPLLVSQGVDGKFSQGLTAIILEHASAKNLIRFTHFQSGNLQTVWNFGGFDVTTTKAPTAMVIPTLPAKTTDVEFFAGFSSPMAGGFTPQTTAPDDIALLANITNAKAATKAQTQAAFDAALRIENPNFHSPNTIDCASCHLAEPASTLIGVEQLKLASSSAANVFAPDPKFVSARSFKQTTTVKSQPGVNVHMLSYRNSSLMIAQRVINETANALAYVNGVVLR